MVKFLYHRDKATVLSNSYKLKGKPFGVNQQYPESIEQARRSLYPVKRQKRAEGYHVRMVRDILYVDGIVYNNEQDEQYDSNYDDGVCHSCWTYI